LQEQEVGDVRELETSGARARVPLSSAEHTIAIVGTGFCGTVLARELLRRASDRPLRVLLVGRAPPGRGVAYARHRHPYLLNVPAGRMSASTADPEEFLRFARKVHPQATGDDYLPRALYGDYLEATLAHAARLCAPQVRLEYVAVHLCGCTWAMAHSCRPIAWCWHWGTRPLHRSPGRNR
jgi:uncharacterized NAD(P)/FAD-binding protein YdhS